MENLKEIRKLRKMTIKELAKNVGMSRQAISKIERGLSNPSYKTVEAIANELGCEIGIILK